MHYSDLHAVRSELVSGDSFSAAVIVTNTGSKDADEVVQFYLSDLEATVPVPRFNLVGFERITLKAGESRNVSFTVTPEMMMLFDLDGKQRLEPGSFRLIAGGCSPSERGLALGAPQPVSIDFRVSAA